jgi:para-nitrobenzyl esterase
MTSTAAAVPLTVRTTAGALRGFRRDGVLRWMGVPYAQPPVGPLRFVAPQPVEPWEGVRPAVEPGAACPQVPHPFTGGIPYAFPQSEDCLYLNVFSPDAADDLPVLVFIHGGAYRSGTSGIAEYDGSALARLGVVVVTISYRLGVFGSMDLRSVGVGDANCTLRDQVAALGWVHDEIAAFGGDPSRVTIVGESSGGNSITTLLATPSAREFFHGAIAQSPHPQTAHSADKKAPHARALVDRLGLSDHLAQSDQLAQSEQPAPDATALGAALRAVPAPRLLAVANQLDSDITAESPLVAAYSPTIDGDVLPEHPLQAMRAGRANPVPLVIGTNHDESSLFKHGKTPVIPNSEPRVELLVAGTDPTAWQRIRGLYGSGRGNERRDWAAAGGDGVFHVPSIEAAEAHASAGNPVWMYRFDHASPLMRAIGLGATHGTELPYLFAAFGTPVARAVTGTDSARTKRRVHEVLAGSWTSFVRDGVPSHRGWVWPRYTTDDRATLAIDMVSRVVHDPDRAVREAWTGVVYDY